jgi:nicotinamidase-related amidase
MVAGTSAAARAIADLRDAFRRVGAPIVHVVRLYRADGSNADACRRGPIEDGLKLVIAGSPGAEIVEELVPQGTVLDAERLLNCPRTSIYEASERDFRVVVVEDAVSGLYDRGRDELRAIGARLMMGAEIAASLRRATA